MQPSVEFKSNTLVTAKLDKMIELMSKKTCTSWTDVLIFVALGLFVIFVFDVFFRFGKWMIARQAPLGGIGAVSHTLPNTTAYYHHPQMMATHPQMPHPPMGNVPPNMFYR